MTDTAQEPGVVIIGAGQAGGELATALRQQGYAGSVTLIGEEAFLPYRRPPLSKTFLAGKASLESLYLKPGEVYARHGIDCRVGVRVTAVEAAGKQVVLSDGTALAYRHLVFATGGRPRPLAVPGAERANLHYLRTLTDVQRLQSHFRSGKRLVLIGGGYIGLETAAVAVKARLDVTVVEATDRVLARVAAPALSAFYEKVHQAQGVRIVTGAAVAALDEHTVTLADGRVLAADLVIAGIGLLPETTLAQAAGAEVAPGGIAVDAACRTSLPDVYAIGDCTFHENLFYGRHMRIESVPHATEQARLLAGNLCGKSARYAAVPWFWSDQYDLKLQMVGLSEGYEQAVVRGDMASSSFIVFYLRDGRVISADAVNRPQDFMLARRLVAERVRVAPEQLEQQDVSLKVLLAQGAAA